MQDLSVPVRPAVRGDLSAVLALYRHLNPDDPAPDPARAEATWGRILASDGTTVFVADLDGMTGSRRESTLRFYERAGFERGTKTAFQVRRP